MKLINVLYRGGGGGEFFGGLLTQHEDVVTKGMRREGDVERWFIERNDLISTHYMDGSKPVSATDWDDTLWNIRLDHGYGFNAHKDYYKNYLWNDWDETKTILLQPSTEYSVRYVNHLMLSKMHGADHYAGKKMINSGFDAKRWWENMWETTQELTELYKSMIPSDHDYIEIDPMDLFHTDDEKSYKAVDTITDYIGLSDYLSDEWLTRIENYRIKNKKHINKEVTIEDLYPRITDKRFFDNKHVMEGFKIQVERLAIGREWLKKHS